VNHRYLLFNKPYGVVCQFSGDEPGRSTLKRYVPVPGVYPAGRLDHDSEGLVLLTSDGQFQHAITDPRFGHERTYWAQVEKIPTEEALKRLRDGVEIARYRTRPAKARLLDPAPEVWPRNPPVRYRASIPTAWIEMTLTEGRNRQVRRMTAAVGYPTLRLVRIAIGTLRIGGMKPGDWRDLTASELARTARELRLL
jgi:23S rRNA pseudouridine2457 synthase